MNVESLDVLPALRPHPKGSPGAPRFLAVVSGVLLGTLIGVLILVPHSDQIATPATYDLAHRLSDVEQLSPVEIQELILKALAALGDRQELGTGVAAIEDRDLRERDEDSFQVVQQGLNNMRRLLPSVKRWTRETLRDAADGSDVRPSDWLRVDRLIYGVRKIVPDGRLRAVAGIRDKRLSEILVDPAYAAELNSDDEAVFVLAHELMHVAARSGTLKRFIDGAAESVRRCANVEPTEDQREDLACDFVGELVLRRFIDKDPNGESAAVRISRVLGYESPAERFARAWEDFCASYNGDPADDSHLNQYQTIRALLALDPELASLMPLPAGKVPSETTDKAIE